MQVLLHLGVFEGPSDASSMTAHILLFSSVSYRTPYSPLLCVVREMLAVFVGSPVLLGSQSQDVKFPYSFKKTDCWRTSSKECPNIISFSFSYPQSLCMLCTSLGFFTACCYTLLCLSPDQSLDQEAAFTLRMCVVRKKLMNM